MMSRAQGDAQSDAEIIARSLDDPRLFGEIFDRHYRSVRAYVARRISGSTAAELTDEVFARAFDLRARYDTARPSSRPWLFGIALNVCRNEARRRSRESVAVRRLGRGDRGVDPADLVAWRVDLEREVADSGLIVAINGLRDDERETLFLFAFGDCTYAEIAETMGIPIGTVRSRLARIRDKLREPIDRLRSRNLEP